MANQKISALPPVASLTGTELIPVVQGGVNKTATPDDVVTFVAAPTSSGTMNLVQLSDGTGGFDSDANLSWNAAGTELDVNNAGGGVGALSPGGLYLVAGTGASNASQVAINGYTSDSSGVAGIFGTIDSTDVVVGLGASAAAASSAIYVNSLNRVYIDGTGGGYVTPTHTLEVNGTISGTDLTVGSVPFTMSEDSGMLRLGDANIVWDPVATTLMAPTFNLPATSVKAGWLTQTEAGSAFRSADAVDGAGSQLVIGTFNDVGIVTLTTSAEDSSGFLSISLTSEYNALMPYRYGSGNPIDIGTTDNPFQSVYLTGITNQPPASLASLGSAATAGAGTRAFISDGLTLGTWGATAVDGGSVVKPVWSNGTNWLNG